MVVNESAMVRYPGANIFTGEANNKIIIPPAASSLITFTLNISHRVSLRVILRNSRTAVTALREYCSKCRSWYCVHIAASVSPLTTGLTCKMCVLMHEPDTRRYHNHRALYETIHWITTHFALLRALALSMREYPYGRKNGDQVRI